MRRLIVVGRVGGSIECDMALPNGSCFVTRNELEQLYKLEFNPDDYIATYYSALDPEVEFFLRNLHCFFDEHDDAAAAAAGEEPWRVLEIGSGPVPISMISASRRSEWIVCSDFLEQNRQKMAHWLTPGRSADAADAQWLPFFRYVAQLERADSEVGLLARVRRSVRAVVPCDVFSVQPLGVKAVAGDKETAGDEFHAIISTLCLEFASLTPDQYTTAVTNAATLLKPGGYLILQGALGNSHYWLSGRSFPSVRLDRQLIETSLAGAGCRTVDWKQLNRVCNDQEKPADHSGVFCCVAQREMPH